MKRQISRHGDDGATLILVLMIITVMSVVMAAIVAHADTSIRTTVALRDQTSANYANDAATNAFLTQLTNSKVTCDAPGGTTATFGDGSAAFYTPVSTQTGARNASVTCTPDTDPADGAATTTTTTTSGSGVGVGGSDNNLPAYALLAMQQNSATEGIVLPQSNKTICVENGSVASNSVINITNNTLGVRLTGTGSAGDCSTGSGASVGPPAINLAIQAYGTNGSGGCQPVGTPAFTPTACSSLAAPITLPVAPTPTDPITRVNQAAVCKTQGGTTYAAFQPGYYSNVALLNSPCSGGTDFAWFSPGTYYFDYGSTAWTWQRTLLGGTPTSGPSTNNPDGSITTPAITSVDPASANTLPGLAGIAAFPTSSSQHPNSCADPSAQTQYPGVQFVFGGASTFTPNSGGNAEVCGTYKATSPPIAIYGARTAVAVGGGGVSAETLCTPVGAPTTCSGSLINSTANGQAQFYFKGFVYAPAAPLILNLKNSNGQIFNWGVIVWNFNLNVNGAAPTAPFIQLPKPNQGFTQSTTTTTTYTYRYVNVWTCPKSGTSCSQTGAPDVRVKIQYSGAGTAKILSWSHQR